MDPQPPRRVSWYHTPFGIAFLAIFVLGPLALPLVWRTPAFGPRGRWIASVLVVAYTVILTWLVWLDVRFVLSQMQ
jgi:hypothetical protein